MKVFADDQVAAWVAARIPDCQRGFGDCCRALGVEHKSRLVAGMVYHNWAPEWGIIEMSGAADDKRWMTRRVLHDIFAYPFSFCRMVLAQHDVDNPARSIWQRLGANEYVIPALRGEDRDGVIATFSKAQWQAGRFCLDGE